MKHKEPIYLFASLKNDPRLWFAVAATYTHRDRHSSHLTVTGTILACANIDALDIPFKQSESVLLPWVDLMDVYKYNHETGEFNTDAKELNLPGKEYRLDFYPSHDDLMLDHFVELM